MKTRNETINAINSAKDTPELIEKIEKIGKYLHQNFDDEKLILSVFNKKMKRLEKS